MTKHAGGPIGSNVEINQSCLISAGDTDLVVLRALGKHTRMAKTIRRTADLRVLVEPHDGRRVYQVAHARTLNLSNILQAARGLEIIASDEFVVRGAIYASANPRRMRRLLHARPTCPATMAEVPRRYVLFDIDGACVPIAFDPRDQVFEEEAPPEDPSSLVPWEAAIEEFIHQALPGSFHGACCWWQFTAGMGFKPGLHMRLLFILDRPMMRHELKRWIGPHMRQHKLDPAVFGAVQQILVAPPILMDGMTDPLRFRTGWLTGHKYVVSPPDPAEIMAKPTTQPPRRELSPRVKSTIGIECAAGRTLPGFEQRLALIGDGPGKHGFHNAILSAVGAWVRAHPDPADTARMEAVFANAILQAPRDDALHPVDYIMEQISALPSMAADIRQMEQATNAARASMVQHEVAPPHELPRKSADAAAGDARDAINAFLARLPALLKMRDAFWREAQARFGEGYPERGIWSQRVAVLVGAGIGKSEAAIAEIIAEQARNHPYRIAYVVPEHKLADDVCRRFNTAAQREIARVWRGISQPDPADPSFTMCRRPAETNLVQLAGGDIGSLCGSSKRSSVCPHHPEAGGACAYLRQRQADPPIWIVPAAMLTKAVPGVMQRKAVKFQVGGRPYAAHPPAFDLLVLDEAPFLSFLGGFDGDGFHVPLDWLDPAQWEVPIRDDEEPGLVATTVGGVLRFGQQVIERLHQGAPALRSEDNIDFQSFETVIRILWRGFEKATKAISPGVDAPAMAEALAPYIARASMLRGVQRFLAVLADVGTRKAHPSAIECSHSNGVRGVRLRWREMLHPTWIDCPLLYLDATARLSVAERWLGPITRLADVQAAAPHMRVIQVHDRVFGYTSMIARAGVASGKAALANQRRVAEVMQVAGKAVGGTGLLVGPKAMIAQMQVQGLIPGAWDVANFGALRGVDSFRSVSAAIVVSRQLPPPAEVERMTSIIFASDVQTVSDWYPIRASARLISDGTGRAAEFECHPDERVEAIRWLICEAEVQQAIGRVRGVRRKADDPVLVIVLNGVDLGQTPIHELISWEDLLELCGPVSQMAVHGVVPKLWADIATVCAPRWSEAEDPGHAAKLWFGRHPAEKAKLARVWSTNEVLLPWSVQPIPLRPVSLGLSGKHHRHVLLAANITLEAARHALDSPKAE